GSFIQELASHDVGTVLLPGRGGLRLDRPIEIGHRLERGLLRWTADQPCYLTIVALDDHFAAVGRQAFQHLSRVPSQLRSRDLSHDSILHQITFELMLSILKWSSPWPRLPGG